MARIRKTNPPKAPDAYIRVLGEEKLAKLVQRTHATNIKNGTELEKLLIGQADECATVISTGQDLNEFIDKCNQGAVEDGVFLATKAAVKKSKIQVNGHEPDFILFAISPDKRHCYIVEMKDGYEFDTKKSPGELEALRICQNAISPRIPFSSSIHMCSFSQLDKKKIVAGFKNVFSEEQVMTGKEFCDILGIEYEAIVEIRKEDTRDNLCYFIEELLKVSAVSDAYHEAYLSSRRKRINRDDFYDSDE